MWIIILLLLLQPTSSIVTNFHAVFDVETGFGGSVPTAWEVQHGMGLGGQSKLTLEGLHATTGAIVFLVVVDHDAWHKWFDWITQVPRDSPTRWQRSMMVCDTPSKIRLPLKNNATTNHLDFTKTYVKGMNGDTKPIEIDFFAYGRYAVLLVACRGTGNSTERIDVSGRVELVTETPSQIPAIFSNIANMFRSNKFEVPVAQVMGINGQTNNITLSHLGYGEYVYPFLWTWLLSFYVLLFLHWSYVLCTKRHLLWKRSRVVDSRLLVVAMGSLGCKILESAFKLSHYDRLAQGDLYVSGLPFISAIMEAGSSTLLLMFLALGALGITIMRTHVYVKEAIVLSVVLALHFITGLSQAFCRESASPSAAIPPSSSSSVSYMIGDPTKRDLDQYYLNSSSCEVLVFSEYVVQALVMLAIIIALNYNIAKLRQHITGVTWGRLTHHLYDKLECFYLFRTIFMLYLLAPTLLLVVQIMILTWRYNWLMAFMVEGANMIIYYNIGAAIFTTSENPFSIVPILLHQRTEAVTASTFNDARAEIRDVREANVAAEEEIAEMVRRGEVGVVERIDVSEGANEGEEKSSSNRMNGDVLEIDMDW